MTMHVLSYNIRESGEGRERGIAAIIRQRQPHVVALLEATRLTTARALAHELAMQLVYGHANDGYHIAWLSRVPLHRWENHCLATLSKTLLEIEVAWKGAPLRLFATHLGARGDRRQPVDEIPAILQVLRPLASWPHLVMGDLNALSPHDLIGAPPAGESKRGDAVDGAPRQAIRFLLEAGFVDCYRALHPQTPGYTYPSAAPWLRLDYIFASPLMAAQLLACDVIRGETAKQVSDHFPIWAEFR